MLLFTVNIRLCYVTKLYCFTSSPSGFFFFFSYCYIYMYITKITFFKKKIRGKHFCYYLRLMKESRTFSFFFSVDFFIHCIVEKENSLCCRIYKLLTTNYFNCYKTSSVGAKIVKTFFHFEREIYSLFVFVCI